MLMTHWRVIAAATAALVIGAPIGDDRAGANTLNIYDGGPASGVVIDLTVTVKAGIASFLFTNNSTGAGAGSDVHEIWFESGLGSLLKTPATPDANGTIQASLLSPTAPPLPGGGLANWAGNLLGVGYDAQKGTFGAQSDNWISKGDAWAITFTLLNGATTADQLLNAIFNQNGTSRIALHIGDCVAGDSCWALMNGDGGGGGAGGGPGGEVPLPAAVILFGSVLAGSIAAAKVRRRRPAARLAA